MKTLILMRHGAADEAATDFERRLTPRGRGECLETAQQLRDASFEFQSILSSSAPRAVESASIIANHCGFSGDVDARRSLYLATPETYLRALRETVSTVSHLLLVAHNPGLSDLAGQLRGTRISLSTADYAVITSDISHWEKFPG